MRVGNTPESLVDRACDAAMVAANSIVEAADAELVKILVVVEARGVPAGEDDCCSGGRGFADSKELAAALMSHATGALKAHGVTVSIHMVDAEGRANS